MDNFSYPLITSLQFIIFFMLMTYLIVRSLCMHMYISLDVFIHTGIFQIVGGMDMQDQSNALARRPHIVVSFLFSVACKQWAMLGYKFESVIITLLACIPRLPHISAYTILC